MTLTLWTVSFALFLVGVCAGFFMHRSDFCMASAFRDLFLFRSGRGLWPLAVLLAATALLFEAARLLGLLQDGAFPWFGPPALTNFLGGLVFGVGMVLAGGCVVGVLYKLGSGSLLAAVAVVGLLFGSALYAEFHPVWVEITRASVLSEEAVLLQDLLGLPSWLLVLGALSCFGFLSRKWWRERLLQEPNAAAGYVPCWQTALVLSCLTLAAVLLTGLPLGVTTTYAKFTAWLESLLWPDHVAALAYFQKAPLELLLPWEQLPRRGGAGARFDVVTLVQLPVILGIVGGAYISARRLGEFQLYWRVPTRQFFMVFGGGVIMATGSRLSQGCNVWHLMGGLPLLTLQSLLFVTGLFPGAWLGSWMLRRVLLTDNKG